jgi:hypothetical protein
MIDLKNIEITKNGLIVFLSFVFFKLFFWPYDALLEWHFL